MADIWLRLGSAAALIAGILGLVAVHHGLLWILLIVAGLIGLVRSFVPGHGERRDGRGDDG